MADFKVKLEISNIEPFKRLVEYISSLTTDERLPLEIREEIMTNLENSMEEK